MRKKLGEILREKGLITEDILELALKEQRKTGELLGEVLLRLGLISEEELLKAIMESEGKKEKEIEVDENAISLVPKELAIRLKVIPIKVEDDILEVASPKGEVEEIKVALKRKTGKEIKIVPITETEFDNLFRIYYGERFNLETIVDDILRRLNRRINVGEDGAVISLVNHIINKAIEDNATDIHIEPAESVIRIKYRVDGVLKIGVILPKDVLTPIVTRIKVLSELDISENRIPQDGSFTHKYGRRDIDVRVSVLPTIYGPAVVLRLLNVSGELPELERLGFYTDELEKIKHIGKQPYGIFLATGPTGSGKTTTLYALLNETFTLRKSIITIEDPPEIKWELIRQVEINPKAGLTFASAIRSILRQDPDIILVGEIRDEETADVAVKAAQTGHYILSTIHTNTATEIPARLINLGVDPYLFAPVFLGAIGQRLVRKICPYCKTSYKASDYEKEVLNLENKDEIILYKGKKCPKCNFTGYIGRTVISELFILDEDLQQAILEGKSSIEIRHMAIEKGMQTMYKNAVKKVLEGITTVEELTRVLKTSERY